MHGATIKRVTLDHREAAYSIYHAENTLKLCKFTHKIYIRCH